jgi:hydroxyacylglutathione hydrolase
MTGTAEKETAMTETAMTVQVLPIDTPSLGDRSYLATDGEVAVVIDPQRDIDRVIALAAGHGVRITHVAGTHLHNDYVTGGLALARATGATYLVPAGAEVAFDRQPAADGDVIAISPHLRLRVVATPGHTFHHVSYAVEAGDRPVGVFTGGSLLSGSVGRTDLVAAEHTEALTHAQYASAHRLAGLLPAEAAVYPTHGFGSFCPATQSAGDSPAIGAETRVNPALTQAEEEFVAGLLAGLDAYPAYYARMAGRTAAGPDAPDLTPPEPADPAELRRRIEAGEWVVGLRNRQAFAAGHLAGTLNVGLDGKMATYLGWLIPWGVPLTLLGDTPGQVAQAQRELVRNRHGRGRKVCREGAGTGGLFAVTGEIQREDAGAYLAAGGLVTDCVAGTVPGEREPQRAVSGHRGVFLPGRDFLGDRHRPHRLHGAVIEPQRRGRAAGYPCVPACAASLSRGAAGEQRRHLVDAVVDGGQFVAAFQRGSLVGAITHVGLAGGFGQLAAALPQPRQLGFQPTAGGARPVGILPAAGAVSRHGRSLPVPGTGSRF